MANILTHLPHIKNATSGREKYDPMYKALFEVYFTLPDVLAGIFKSEEAILTEQVTKVAGLDVLQKTVQSGTQDFMGAKASYLQPVLDTTVATISMTLNLNIRNVTDAFVLKVFKAWEKLGYDITDGTRTLMADYCADNLRIAQANRDGTIWRVVKFHKVLLTEVKGLDDVDYSSQDIYTLDVTFTADWWDEELG